LRHFYDDPTPYFQTAAQIDPLDPDPWVYHSKWSRGMYEMAEVKEPKLLGDAVKCLQESQLRDPFNFIYKDSLSDVYVFLSETQKEKAEQYLQSAYQAQLDAQMLNPGSDRIAYNLGILAEKLNQPEKAIEYFRKAVDIEDQYRVQFKEMYPGYPLWSRLGQSRYEYAKNYLFKQNSASK
jgi:tetratricopeptide (TPR) repeat protein